MMPGVLPASALVAEYPAVWPWEWAIGAPAGSCAPLWFLQGSGTRMPTVRRAEFAPWVVAALNEARPRAS